METPGLSHKFAMKNYLSLLCSTSLFNGLTAEELQTLLSQLGAVVRSYGKGEALVLAGEPSRRVGIVLNGELEAYRPGPQGTRIPITHENLDQPYYHSWRLTDPDGFRNDLGAVTYKNLIASMEKALAKSGNTLAALDFYIPLHMNVKAQKTVCEMVGLPLEKSYYLRKHGHMGQLDMLIGAALAEAEGLIHKGDLVGLNSMGISYTWGGAAIRW